MTICPLVPDKDAESERLRDVVKVTQQDLGFKPGRLAPAPEFFLMSLHGLFLMVTAPHASRSPGQAQPTQPGLILQPKPWARRLAPVLGPPHGGPSGDRFAVYLPMTRTPVTVGVPKDGSSTSQTPLGLTQHHATLPGVLVPTCPWGRRSPW